MRWRPAFIDALPTFLTLQRALSLLCQAQPEGVKEDEEVALRDEAGALASSCLPLIVRRMDANTMLPGRGTAVEMAFSKRFEETKIVTFNAPPVSTRTLQLVGLCLGYATAVLAADVLLSLRVVDCMLPAGRSMADIAIADEVGFACKIHQVLSGAFPTYDATFIASLRTKWTDAAMAQMRSARGLLDASETEQKFIEDSKTRLRADVAQHGLKRCALPSCDKPEVSVQQFIVFQMSLGVVLLRGARGTVLARAQADLPRNHGRAAGCG